MLIALIPLMTGCFISSLNPLYTEKDLCYDLNILGEWEKDNEVWKFERKVIKNKPDYYILSVKDSNKVSYFDAYMLKIKNVTYLNVSFSEKELDKPFYLATHFPTHTFLKIEIKGDKLLTYALDYELISKEIENKNLKIDYEVSQSDDILLTAKTADLQDFVSANQQFFGKAYVLTKK